MSQTLCGSTSPGMRRIACLRSPSWIFISFEGSASFWISRWHKSNINVGTWTPEIPTSLKASSKPKPVVPEPVVVPVPEPPLVNEPVNRGVRGRRPSTPEQIKNRIEDIKSKFSENNKLDDKDYQFLYKNDPELLKTIVRPKKRKPKMDFKLNPEEIDYEPMGKLGDYWTTSTTGDYDVNYNSK